QHHLHQLGILEHGLRRAIKTTQRVHKLSFRQVIGRWVRVWQLGSAVPRNKKMYRGRSVLPAQLAGEFKTYQGPHTMTKESERCLQVRKQNACYCLHEKRKIVKRRLHDAVFATGELDRADLYFR